MLSFLLAVSKAYSVLSDEEKRKRYDRFGDESVQASGMNGGRAHYTYAYDDEFDPNEIFRMFFGNDFDFGGDGGKTKSANILLVRQISLVREFIMCMYMYNTCTCMCTIARNLSEH